VRIIPALAALAASVTGLFKRAPKRTVIETPLKDVPAPAGTVYRERSYFPQRRGRSKPGRPGRGFLRAIQHAVMREPFVPDPKAADAVNDAARAEYHRKWRLDRKRARRAA
jgi:hypothetical protein